jgi:hypothetical protein
MTLIQTLIIWTPDPPESDERHLLECPECESVNVFKSKQSRNKTEKMCICRDCWHKGNIDDFLK